MDCVRSITFLIPGGNNGPDIEVAVVEDNGSLEFVVKVLDDDGNGADLRGLFFNLGNDAKLGGLTITEDGGTVTDVHTPDVIDLGNGANANGKANPFDVGIEFGTAGAAKDDLDAVSFRMSNAANNLTLDDIAHQLFGVRTTSVGTKLTTTAPAAPDAKDDGYSIFEDGQSGLDDPSTIPEGVRLAVLANDTDADGDTLMVTDVFGAQHGTVTIVDGADADLLPGDAVMYTPDEDYAGTDSFTYCISDNHGGTDFADVAMSIVAVADVPDVDVQVFAGAAVNQAILRVTATQTDADSSEFIDRIMTSALPAGVTLAPLGVNPAGEPNVVVQDFLLTLPIDTDTSFDLTFTAVAKETSNGDEQTGTESVEIVYEYNSTTTPVDFFAQDQSIWASGDEFVFVDDRFVGVDTGPFDEQIGSELFAGIEGDIRIGLESTLTFEGGEIDAAAAYDVTIETNYNKTTDQLLIDTGAVLSGASFVTQGPEGTYELDFVWDVFLHAFAGVDIDFGSIDFDPLGIIPGDQTLDLGGVNEQVDVTVNLGAGSIDLLDLDSDTLSGTIPFPPPLDDSAVNFDWPDISTAGAFPPEPIVASGSSNNFVELELDVDELITVALGLPVNPLHPVDFSAGPFFADIDLLDVDVVGGLNLLQHFALDLGELTGVLEFENGAPVLFTIGDSLLISNAAQRDADHDGLVEFAFNVVPTAMLSNETDLGFNIGAEIALLRVELGYDVTIPNPFGDDVHISDSIQLGPLADFGESVPVADINVFDDTFALNFGQESVAVFA